MFTLAPSVVHMSDTDIMVLAHPQAHRLFKALAHTATAIGQLALSRPAKARA